MTINARNSQQIAALLVSLGVAAGAPAQAPASPCGDVTAATVAPGGINNNVLLTEFYVADIDGDGLEDIALGDFGQNLAWRRNVQGSGSFASAGLLASGAVHAAAFGDLDGNSTTDLVYQDYYTHAYLRRNLGGGTFGARELLWQNTSADDLLLSDLDGDGDRDLVWWGGANEFGVCMNLGGGNFAPRQPLGPYARDVVAVDLDADGDRELVARSGLDLNVYWNLTGAAWSALPQTLMTGVHSIASLDLQGDGYPEIFVGKVNGDVVALQNSPAVPLSNLSPTLFVHTDVNNTDRWAVLEVADYNGDGQEDLLVQWTSVNDFYQRRYSWIEQRGGLFAAEQELVGYEYGPSFFSSLDLQGDGGVDLVYLRGITDPQGQYVGGSVRVRQRPYSVAAGPVGGGVNVVSVTGGQAVGAYFDVAVQTAAGANVWGLDTATTSGALFTSVDVEVYITHGSHVGKVGDADAWVKVGQGTRPFGAGSAASPAFRRVELDRAFFLPPGNYGMAVFHRASGVFSGQSTMACTASAVAGAGQPGEVVIHPSGVGKATSYGTLSSPGLFPANLQTALWNGRLCYDDNCEGRAASGAYSAGCENSNQAIPLLAAMTSTPTPVIGATYRLAMQSRMSTYVPGALQLGFSSQAFGGVPLPLDLAFIGAPGCALAASVDIAYGYVLSPAATIANIPIPNVVSFVGFQFYGQIAVADPAANVYGVVYSNGFASRVGF